MQKKEQKNIIFVDRSSRPSRFLVDIPRHLEEKTAQELEKKKPIFNFRREKKNTHSVNFQEGVEFVRGERDKISFTDIKNGVKSAAKKRENNLNRLMLYPAGRWFFKLLFAFVRLFFRLIYRFGWLVIWIFNFFYLLLRKVIFTGVPRVISVSRKITVKPKKSFKNKSLVKQESSQILNTDTIISENTEPEINKDKKNKLKHRRKFFFSRHKLKPLLATIVLMLVFVLPLKGLSLYGNINSVKGQVLGATDSAIKDIAVGAEALKNEDFQLAGEEFHVARTNFLLAGKSLEKVNRLLSILAPVVPIDDVRLASAADNLARAGAKGAEIGVIFSKLLEEFSGKETDYQSIIENLEKDGQRIARLSNELYMQVVSIEDYQIPEKYKIEFNDLKSKIRMLNKGLAELNVLARLSKAILGWEYDKRYLLVFQNNTELRASGGFIGSYALADFRDGKIINLEIPGGGSYGTEAGLYDMIKSPEPLRLVNPRWYFWDANWWPDWPQTAEKLAWFFERSNGPSVDGVIGITPIVLESLLGITGPIDMQPEYDLLIDENNAWNILQTRDPEKLNSLLNQPVASSTIKKEPKKIIGDVMNKLLSVLPDRINKDSYIDIIKALDQNLREKHILVYLNDKSLNGQISEFNWDGRIKDTKGDYLMVVNSNIAGGKSDRRIKETINQRVDISPDGAIINTLTITRQHTGVKREQFSGVRNVNWMRIYVPQGSTLLSANGFSAPDKELFEPVDKDWQDDIDVFNSEGQATTHLQSNTKIYNEFNKTVFANWSQVDPGESTVITIKYLLPFSFSLPPQEDNNWIENISEIAKPNVAPSIPYSLLVQKQPGSLGSTFKSQLILPREFKINWKYPDGLATSHGWIIDDVLNEDRYWAITAVLNN